MVVRYGYRPFRHPPSRPIRGWGDIHPLFGDTFHLLDGRVVHRGEPLPPDSGPVLPGVLRQRPAYGGELIPVTAHGSSLFNLLTAKDWKAVRVPLIEAQNQVCEACGRRQKKGLEAHEIWEYHVPEYGKQGIQRLQSIKILCNRCHAMYHLALARRQGRFDEVFFRLMALQRWDHLGAEQFLSDIDRRQELHNRFSWTLDLSVVPLDVLHIQEAKWSVHPQRPRILSRPNPFEAGKWIYTGILGKAWMLGDTHYAAIPSPLQGQAA